MKKNTSDTKTSKDSRTFTVYPEIKMKKARFTNRFGIELAGDMYLPVGYEKKKNPAIIVSGPFGGVKEQASGLYAQEYAKYGFVGLAFDQSFTGESGGEVRDVASPEIFTEDFSAAVDYLGTREFVDRERIGVTGICGLSGMALTAAGTDPRIKAVATVSMYDMSRSIARGYRDGYTKAQRERIKTFLSEQRYLDYEAGEYKKGPHEIAFDENGNMLTDQGGLPTVPEDVVPHLGPVVEAFYNYYVKRAYHPNSINSTVSWTQTTPVSFFSFDLMKNIADISPRPVMLVAGENAHSRYYAEDAYREANEPKELVIVPNADHVDLYDNMEKIPFDKLSGFFKKNLK
ncbi:MAG: alpha/beta hydrolase [Clostridia bacterium]|nr:alpha/beta hydrolase [Clostridia bacterium]